MQAGKKNCPKEPLQFKNTSDILAVAWSNAKHFSTDHACDTPEAQKIKRSPPLSALRA